MINRKIAMSAMSIVTALALTTGGAFALFNDTTTSSSNTFSAGTIELLLSDSAVNDGIAESDAASVTSSFGASGMAPGECTGDQTLNVRNNGSIDGVLSLTASNSNGAMTPYLRINKLEFDSVPVDLGTVNTNGNIFADLQDFAVNSPRIAGNLSAGTTLNLVMDVCFDNTAPNNLQGASNDLTLTLTLEQAP